MGKKCVPCSSYGTTESMSFSVSQKQDDKNHELLSSSE